MKKMDKNYIIIFLVCIISILFVWKSGYLFGSTTDWISQHIAFPDYFRNLFYETHEFFPSFAFNIGAGQNIYNFSYYGLFNPIILISYFLPFVSMKDYITITNILLFILFGLLMYKWLSKNNDKKISLLLSAISVLASPVLFHFHRHFMFVNYLPFLVLALIAIDKYIEKNKSILLIISVFLIITSSYYYSIPCILVIIIYYIYRYIELYKKVIAKDLIYSLLKLFLPIFIAILMSSVLILPTFFCLIDGRMPSDINILKLFIPSINIDSILYDNYSLGLTAICVVSTLLMFLSKNKKNKFLSVTLFIIITLPIIIYLLNGMLYVRDKVLIPFLPLFVLLIGEFLNELFDKKIKFIVFLTVLAYSSVIFLIFGYFNIIYYIEVVLVILFVCIYLKYDKKIFLIIYIILSSFVNFYVANMNEKYVSISSYNKLNSKDKYVSISNTIDNNQLYRFNNLADSYYAINKIYDIKQLSTSIYSSSQNSYYKNFYINIFKNNLANRNNLMLSPTGNILFNMFMGVKYIYSSYQPIGYNKIGDNLYSNEDVLPIFYVRYNDLSEDIFNEIEYPYNMEVLLNNVISKSSNNKEYKSNIESYDLKYTYEKNDDLEIEYKDNKYYINAKKNTDIKLKLNDELKNKILFLDFRINNQHECSENDSEIKINNITNKLTCKREFYENDNYVFHYVISSNDIVDILDISIKKGLYIIDDINTYILDYDYIKDINNDIDVAIIDKYKTKGDTIELTVENKKGYFVTSLPYDESYKIYVDGVETTYEKINISFVGFKIEEGKHTIKITYKAKFLDLSKILSLFGVVLLVIYLIKKGKTNSQI